MYTRSAALLVVLCAAPAGRGAVVVIGNYTPDPVAFTVAEPNAKAREHTLAANHVAAVYVTGPAVVTFVANGKETKWRLDPYNAYAFLPAARTGVRLEGIELPGAAPERDARPELNPVPRDPPVKVPVTLCVDDTDPRAERLWQKDLRARLDEAGAALEKATGIKLVVAGFDTWRPDPDAKTTTDLLADFEKAVRVKPGALAVGWTTRKIDDKVDPAFGAGRGLGGRHILLRETRPRNEPERVEVLLQFAARALGAVGTPDPGSAMRPKLGDGYALRAGSVLRLDPLNALALNLWADERRRDPGVEIAGLSEPNRQRLARVYKAVRQAVPDDALAAAYLDDLDRAAARVPGAAEKNAEPKNPDRPPVKAGPRAELAARVVRAVTARAKRNTGPDALTGDELTAAYVRAAAEATAGREAPETVPAFLLGLGVALDDTGALAEDEAARPIESADERKERLAVLGNPTLAGRRDLCRRFFLGCAMGELLAPERAEAAAVARALTDLTGPTGLCVPAVAAEFAGVAFARAAQTDGELLRDVTARFRAADYLPPMKGLRNGLSAEKFAELYGDATDDRFLAVLADVRKRLKAMNAYR